MFKCTHCEQEFQYGFHTRPGGLEARRPLASGGIEGTFHSGDDTCPKCEDGVLRPVVVYSQDAYTTGEDNPDVRP